MSDPTRIVAIDIKTLIRRLNSLETMAHDLVVNSALSLDGQETWKQEMAASAAMIRALLEAHPDNIKGKNVNFTISYRRVRGTLKATATKR